MVPDTGSEIMAMSASYAAQLGLKILTDTRHRTKVQFVDGSKVLTDGLVKDVSWQFEQGDNPVLKDFHIIEALPVDAVVSIDFLDKYDVFSKYEHCIAEC